MACLVIDFESCLNDENGKRELTGFTINISFK